MIITKTTAYIAEELKRFRLEAELTQSELARKAGINSNAYAKIERAERRANTDTLEKICRALKIRSSDVLPF